MDLTSKLKRLRRFPIVNSFPSDLENLMFDVSLCVYICIYNYSNSWCWLIMDCVFNKFQVIELPIKHPELFESLGIAQPKVPCCRVLCVKSLFRSQGPCLSNYCTNSFCPPLCLGSSIVWATRYWEDFVGQSRGSSY